MVGASFVFYAWNFPILLLLLITSILLNAAGSYGVIHAANSKRQRAIATGSVIINLLILAIFKYAGLLGKTFFSENRELVDFLIAIPLPVGISFFTFQGISLVVDTFRHDSQIRNEKQVNSSFWKHLCNTSLFISLFPQLVAGPIVKAHDFFPQIKPKLLKNIDWDFVFTNLVIGYFLKMVVADNLKDFTFELTWPYFERLSSLHLIALLFAYSIQIFADFAGYSLIAIGLSQLFGYRIPQNFNFPYIATSFADFWRRWHISLSSFLKEYLYIPLGGNRKGRVRTYLNLMAVMALGGLWHGAAWSYMIWGTTHGVLLAVERLLKDITEILGAKKSKLTGLQSKIAIFLKTTMVFVLVSLAWLLFKLPDFKHVLAFFTALGNNQHIFTNYLTLVVIFLYSLPVVIYHLYYLYPIKNEHAVRNILKPVSLACMLALLLLNSGSPQDFIYFQF
ncbi:MAG: MBOAT family protein [Marinilabiliaceae bacterium]|nr:MBOAT family protein [Marinilabiliaceae bacterium]